MIYKRYLLFIRRFLEEGLSYFVRLPRHLTVFGFGVSAAIFLFLIWQKIRRKEKLKAKAAVPLAVLILYLVFIFIITTVARKPDIIRMFNPYLFHTLREILSGSRYSLKMIFINLVLLFPLGFLMPPVLEYRCSFRDILFLAFLISCSIECTQYLFNRGFMETDDVMHNCMGALLGYFLSMAIKKIFKPGENDKTRDFI